LWTVERYGFDRSRLFWFVGETKRYLLSDTINPELWFRRKMAVKVGVGHLSSIPGGGVVATPAAGGRESRVRFPATRLRNVAHKCVDLCGQQSGDILGEGNE
jgi:hypothetical protein